MPRTDRISRRELRASLGLAGIFGLRMLGMFVILPVFALYARDLPGGASQTLVGAALGAYGLSQALLQVPFGWLSDRWGRKPAIYLGLLVFALGSLIAGLAQDIYWVIAGRAIQGAGAISAAVIALTADLTTEENRTKAMAIIGMTIGATFALSMVIAPALEGAIGVPGIFLLTGVLAIAAMLVVRFVVPDPQAGPGGGLRGRDLEDLELERAARGRVPRDRQAGRLGASAARERAVRVHAGQPGERDRQAAAQRRTLGGDVVRQAVEDGVAVVGARRRRRCDTRSRPTDG